MKLMNKIRIWISNHELFCSILVVVFLSFVTFLPSVKNAGFYVDDYHMIFAGNNSGPDKIRVSYMVDRPAAGYLMAGLYSVFGSNIHYYQALVIALNISVALCLMWMVRKVWPNQKAAAFFCAMLAVVYPGFVDSMHAFNYSMILTSYSWYVFSIALSIKALTSSQKILGITLTLTSMALAMGSLLLIEYYLGLEILRIGLLYLVVHSQLVTNASLKLAVNKTLKIYLPYLITTGVFFIWRFFFFSSYRSVTNLGMVIGSTLESPFSKVAAIITGLFGNFFKITLLSWFEPFYRQLITLKPGDLLFFLGLCLVAASVVYIFFKILHPKNDEVKAIKDDMLQFGVLGFVAVIGTSLPIVFVNRAVTFEEYGRYTLPGMIGGILILVAFFFNYIKAPIRPLVLSFLILSGIVTQLGVGKALGTEWEASKGLWWQLSWRAPSIKPGTLLTGLVDHYNIREGFYLWGPANMIYYPIDGNVTIAAETLNPEFIKTIQHGDETERNFRSYIIYLKPKNLLVLSVPSEKSCLHLISGNAPDYSVYDSSSIQLIGQYSKIDQVDVLVDPVTPPINIFGTEPDHGWCYYYQKAELAVQKLDYQETASLWEETEILELYPEDQVELVPFILSFAELGNEDKLKEILPQMNENKFLNANFCKNIRSRSYQISETANQLLLELTCTQ